MCAGHPLDEGTILVPPAFAGKPGDVDMSGLWNVLRLAMGGGIALERTWLVRWKGGGPGGAQGDDDVRARDIASAIGSRTAEGPVCLRYDQTSILVLAADTGWSGPQAAVAEAAAGGSGDLIGDLEFWQAVAVSDEGLHFRLPGADTQPEHLDQPASAASERSKLVLSDAEYTFFPLWDVAANQVFAYLCRAAWSTPDAETFTESSPKIRGAAPELQAAIDLALFRAGVRFVQNALDNYGSVDVVIPVHCGIFSSPRAIATLFESVGREIWPILENVVFELIAELAPDQFRNVEAAIAQLASYGRPLMLRVEAGDEPSAIPDGEWLSVGFEPAASGDEITAIEDFVGRLRNLGRAAHVLGLTDAPATVAAVNAGYAYIGSDAIAPPLTGDDSAQTQPADVLKAILASRAAR